MLRVIDAEKNVGVSPAPNTNICWGRIINIIPFISVGGDVGVLPIPQHHIQVV